MYKKANKGLRLYFYSTIATYICMALVFFYPYTFLAAVALLVCLFLAIIKMVGLYIGRVDIGDYKTSFMLSFLYWLLILASFISSSVPLLSSFFWCFGCIVSYYIVYNICDASKQALIYSGGDEKTLNAQCNHITLLLCAKMVTTIVISVLAVFEIYPIAVVLIYGVVLFASQILLLRFIYQSFRAFGRNYSASVESAILAQ
jgi:hypothetical protein